MIYGYTHQGSGIGNQLHRYIATRITAQRLGVDYRMVFNPDASGKPGGFKCESFMIFDKSKLISELPEELNIFNEKKVLENGIDIRSYDPEFNYIQDNTIMDGEFQDERYWEYHEHDLIDWLHVGVSEIADDVCVIGFRGGEFSVFPDLFLTKEYWDEGIRLMKKINPDMKFEVHTDDKELAKQFFPDLNIIQDAEINWRSMRFAKHAIIANSSFFILPRWLSRGVTIAPRGWARRNIGVWALPSNYYSRFLHI